MTTLPTSPSTRVASVLVGIRLHPDLLAGIDAAADRAELSRSEWSRRVLALAAEHSAAVAEKDAHLAELGA